MLTCTKHVKVSGLTTCDRISQDKYYCQVETELLIEFWG